MAPHRLSAAWVPSSEWPRTAWRSSHLREPRRDVLAAMRAAHPYEEPAFDIFALAPLPADVGLGRVGSLPRPEPLTAFVSRVRAALPQTSWGVRAAGDADVTVSGLRCAVVPATRCWTPRRSFDSCAAYSPGTQALPGRGHRTSPQEGLLDPRRRHRRRSGRIHGTCAAKAETSDERVDRRPHPAGPAAGPRGEAVRRAPPALQGAPRPRGSLAARRRAHELDGRVGRTVPGVRDRGPARTSPTWTGATTSTCASATPAP